MAEELSPEFAPCEMCGGGLHERDPCLCGIDDDPWDHMCEHCSPDYCVCSMCDGDPCLCGVPSWHEEPAPAPTPRRRWWAWRRNRP